jgi:prevent-host-death family protein
MKDVKVSDLRRRLPKYLIKVRRGERLRVTSRGTVIAVIPSPTPSNDEAAAARVRLRGSVLRYDNPLEPAIAPGEWDANR